jgi:orotate phosphoribosyltransferase-like protein
MTSGIPLSETDKQFIIKNKDKMFIGHMASELNVSRDAVSNVLKCEKKKDTS